MRTGKLISALVTAGALTLVPSVTSAPAAHAASENLICQGGSIEASLGPGMTFQTKTMQVTGTGDLGQCASQSDSSVYGGSFTYQATINGGCPNGGQGNGTATVTWSNGKTSKLQVTFVVNQDQTGMSGVHVVSGEFAGDSGSFAGPATYLPWYQCVFPTGVQNARAVINEGFLS